TVAPLLAVVEGHCFATAATAATAAPCLGAEAVRAAPVTMATVAALFAEAPHFAVGFARAAGEAPAHWANTEAPHVPRATRTTVTVFVLLNRSLLGSAIHSSLKHCVLLFGHSANRYIVISMFGIITIYRFIVNTFSKEFCKLRFMALIC